MGPALTELTIGDAPSSWEAAGFAVVDNCVRIGSVTIRFQAPGENGRRGVIAWAFDGVEDDGSIDGMLTLDRPAALTPRPAAAPAPETAPEPAAAFESESGLAADPVVHPNGVFGIDHVVVMTDDLDRTSNALRAFGFESRRRRSVPKSDPPHSQIFWWAGDVIIELAGPDESTGNGPATVWGLALTANDLDATSALLGEAMGTPRDAVQPGRRIASLRGKALDISVPTAIMTPHV